VLYSQALKHIPEKADEISGLMITGVFGGALVPPMMGVFSDMTGSQSGSLIVIAFFALYLLFCGIKIKKA
jgi:fucose permease